MEQVRKAIEDLRLAELLFNDTVKNGGSDEQFQYAKRERLQKIEALKSVLKPYGLCLNYFQQHQNTRQLYIELITE